MLAGIANYSTVNCFCTNLHKFKSIYHTLLSAFFGQWLQRVNEINAKIFYSVLIITTSCIVCNFLARFTTSLATQHGFIKINSLQDVENTDRYLFFSEFLPVYRYFGNSNNPLQRRLWQRSVQRAEREPLISRDFLKFVSIEHIIRELTIGKVSIYLPKEIKQSFVNFCCSLPRSNKREAKNNLYFSPVLDSTLLTYYYSKKVEKEIESQFIDM